MHIEPQEPATFSQELRWIAEEAQKQVSPENDPSQALRTVAQAFRRIAEGIVGVWGSDQFNNYMEKLLIDERGDRKGFPPEVAEALLRLSRMHAERYGYGYGNKDNFWVEAESRSARGARI